LENNIIFARDKRAPSDLLMNLYLNSWLGYQKRLAPFHLVLLLFSGVAYTQDSTDSLERYLPRLNDEQKVRVLNQLAVKLQRNQSDKALLYAKQALELSESCHFTLGKALTLQTFGIIYYSQTNFNKSQTYHQYALHLFQSLDDKENGATELRYLGLVDVNQSRYSQALEKYEQALKIFRELKVQSGIADCYGNIATVHNFLGDYQKAIQFSFKSLEYREKVGKTDGIGYSYNSIGFLYTKLHKYVLALNYLEKAHTIAVKNNDRLGQVFPLINIGEVYRVWGDEGKATTYLTQALILSEQLHHQSGLFQANDKLGLIARKKGKLAQALNYQLKALAICEQLKNKEGLTTVLNHIGQVYFEQKAYAKALGYYQKSLLVAQEIGSKPSIKECYLYIAQTHYRLTQFEQSARFYELYQGTQDTLFNELSERVIGEIQQKYEAEKKAGEFKILQQEKQIQELALAKGRNFRNFLLFIVALVIMILVLAIYLYFIKSRGNRELKQINQQLLDSEANLQQLNATKDKLFSIVSHDLRGPINTFSGFLKIQAAYPDSFTEAEMKDFIRKMDTSVKNLSGLLNNLLHWSLSQMGHIEFAPERLQLESVVEDNLTLLEENAQIKKVSLEMRVSEGTSVVADRNMLDIVLRNLINNAIKFSHQDGKVYVYAQQFEQFAEISVVDTGVGITSERMEGLFHTQNAHSTRGTANEPGTGLGLLLCREFVERCGGNIQVKSELNEGTTFIFTLPTN
jgi:signal transduction histidine kinase